MPGNFKAMLQKQQTIKNQAQTHLRVATNKNKTTEQTLTQTIPNRHRCQVIFDKIQTTKDKIERMNEKFQFRASNLMEAIKDQRGRQEVILNELHQSLNQLKQVDIHKGFLTTKMSNSLIHKKSLYDFRNSSDINKLVQKAKEEMEEMDNLLSIGEQYLSIVDQQSNEINKNNKLLKQDMSKLNDSEDKQSFVPSKLNQEEIRQMQSIVLELTTIYDKTKHIVDNPSVFSEINLSDETEQMKKQLKILENLSDKVKTTCESALHINQTYQQFQKKAADVYKSQEAFHITITEKLDHVEGLRVMLYKRNSSISKIFDEIMTLTEWYNYFVIAYKNLLLECHRRNQAETKIQKRMQEMRKELILMRQEEERHRYDFFNDYARYLPSTLCESIVEEQPKYDIHPPPQPSNLPDIELTPQDIAKLQKEIKALTTDDSTGK